MMLAIDPGKRACGVALFNQDTTLNCAGYVTAEKEKDGPRAWLALASAIERWLDNDCAAIDQIVFEQPGSYRSDKPYKTLILQDLVAINALLCGRFPKAEFHRYRPNEWKGSMNKEQTQARAYARLQPFETQVIKLPQPKSRQHNVWDAIGIGLHHLGRFKPRRNYDR